MSLAPGGGLPAETPLAVVRTSTARRGVGLAPQIRSPLQADEVRISVEYCGLCGSDAHIWRADEGYDWVSVGRVLGHEVVGVISELGRSSAQREWHVGDRVVPIAQVGCGDCESCERDFANGCSHKSTLGLSRDGGAAQSVVCRDDALVRVPAALPPLTASLAEPASVAARAVLTRAGISADDSVVVSGPGAVGLLTAVICADVGCTVTLLGTAADVASRAALAADLGLRLVDHLDETIQPTVWFEASGSPQALALASNRLPVAGSLILLALYPTAPQVSINDLVRKEVTAITSYSSFRADYEAAMRMLCRRPRLGELLVQTREVHDVEAAFDAIGSGQAVKSALAF